MAPSDLSRSKSTGLRSSPPSSAAPAIDWPRELAHHERWLRTVVAARVRSRQAVDEILQEVSLAAVEQRAPLADPTKVAPWLYRLAVTQALLFRRKLGRQRRLTERYALRVQATEEDGREADPLTWLLGNERQQLVRQALDGLAPRDREILLLKYSEGWNYHQLASHLGIGHSAVEARLHRARGKLRSAILSRNEIEVGHS